MSNAATSSNSNPIGVTPQTNVTVATVVLKFTGKSHQVFLIGHFSADTVKATGGIAVASILVDGNLTMNTEVNNLQGNTGSLLSLSGVVTVKAGNHTFDLQASATNMNEMSVHHRSISAIDLGA